MRGWLVRWHRWVGLSLTVFLCVAGLSGSALAFREQLDAWLNPAFHHATTASGGEVLAPYALYERASAQAPAGTYIDTLPLRITSGNAVLFPLTSSSVAGDYDALFLDPVDGRLLGMRPSGISPFQRETLMPFLFALHHSLALGESGQLLMGIVAVLWTLDTFFAFFLTLPKKQKQARKPWLARWRPAWSIKLSAGFKRINYDLHRATGLWLCIVMLMFSWSSVMFNLGRHVYLPAMSALFEFDDHWRNLAGPFMPLEEAEIPPWPRAHAQARDIMARFAHDRGLTIHQEESLRLDRQRGLYAYMVHSSADFRTDTGNTAILFDARSGQLNGWWLPTGSATGNTVSNWLGALHMGHVFGLPYRIFIAVCGVMLAALCASGCLIWLHKRKSHNVRLRRME